MSLDLTCEVSIIIYRAAKSTPFFFVMAAVGLQQTLDGRALEAPKTRKSYSREFKLSVVKFYHENNLYQTAKQFSINTKTIGRWVAGEEQIKSSRKASKRVTHSRRCQYSGRGLQYTGAYYLLGAYFLTTYAYKRMRLLTRVYGIAEFLQTRGM